MVIGGTVRVIRGRRDPFARWTATGALLGVGAILLHSLFDYNLSKITANGLVCAVLLGVAFAAARTSGSRSSRTRRLRYWRVPLAKPLARAGVGLVAVGLLASIPFFPMISALRADIHFNRYLAGVDEPDDYFFLPVARPARAGGMPADDSTTSTEALDRALALCPDNPRYLAEAAGRAWARADDRLRQRAVERAHAILGSDLERRDPTGFERIVAAIASTIRPQVLDERRPLLDEAEAHLRRAIAAVPTAARYHLDLADVLAELDPTRRHVSEIGREVRVALSLAPNRPAVLFDAGRLLLLAAVPAEESPSDTTLRLALVQDCFRQAMEADVAYGSLIYPLVQATMGGRSALLAVTPHTVEAYEQLYHVLWQAGEWVPALACLDTLEAMAESDGALAAGSGYTADADSGSRRLQVKTFVAQRRGDVLGILGRWDERAEAVSHYRALLRRRLAEDVAEAHRLRTMGRPQEALAVCLRLLQGDWSNPDALLEAAEIATLPRVLDGLPRWNTSLDLLYRLVINNTVLSPSVYERATKVLDGLVLRQASDRLVAAFIRGALAVLAGRASEGTAVLDGLAEREDDVIAGWRQRHLIWYYLGLGHEAMHDRAKAIAAYRRVVDIVPTHRLSLLRLCDLYAGAVPSEGSSARESARSVASRLAALTPEVPCAVNFGGHVTLLGYTLSQDNRSSQMAGAAPGRGRWTMTYYWQFHERLFDGYQLAVHFCNARWDTLFYGDYRIRSDGQPYPQDSPRCGEVVVERKTLVADPAGVAYVRIFFWHTKGQDAIPRELSVDGGGTACEVPFRRPDVRPDGGRSGM